MVSLAILLSKLTASAFLHDEPHFCANTEIRYADEHDLLKHGILAQFVGGLLLGIQFLCAHETQMHHIADIQVKDPVVCKAQSQYVSHTHLVLSV